MADRLRVCALYPGPDEHLRRPRQPAAAAAGAATGAGSGSSSAASASATRSTPTRTTSSTSAAARTATRRCAPRTWPPSSATRSTRRRGDGKVVFAVCGGYQLLGHGYELGGERLPGVGLVDLETVREDGPRLIGNVAIEVEIDGDPRVLAGFENHGGRTRLGSGRAPLGRVLRVMATTAARASRASRRRTAPSSAPTCTARCCPRTPGSRTG